MNMKGYLLEVEINEYDIETMLEHLKYHGFEDFDFARLDEVRQMLLLKYFREINFYVKMLHGSVEHYIEEQKEE